jgi:signal transduction histidine kinase
MAATPSASSRNAVHDSSYSTYSSRTSDGWEVCRLIKADPETSSVLVLQFSATYVQEKDTVRALEGGADACLTHPAEAPVLVATVRALLRTARAEESLRAALARETAARVAAEGAQTAAEAANRIKDEFLATLSHELRSPLGTILNWMNLLRSGTLDAAQTERAFEAIERNTRLQAEARRRSPRRLSHHLGEDALRGRAGGSLDDRQRRDREHPPCGRGKGDPDHPECVDPTLGPVSGMRRDCSRSSGT